MIFSVRRQRLSLERRARAVVCANAALSAEYDRVQRARRIWLQHPVALAISIPLAIALLVAGPPFLFSGAYQRMGIDRYLAVVSVAESMLACGCALLLHRLLRAPSFLGYSPELPVSDGTIVWRSWLVVTALPIAA